MSLKSLATRVKEVMVDGEAVTLRLPPVVERNKLLKRMSEYEQDSENELKSNVAAIELWDEIAVTALMLCVEDKEDMTEEDWQRLITFSRTEEADNVEGLPELLSECLKLCGFGSEVKKGDAVDEVLENMGESHS